MEIRRRRRRKRAFTNGELHPDLTLGTTGGTTELKGSDAVRIIRVGEVLEREPKGSNERLGGFGRFGVEDFEDKERIMEGKVDWEGKVFVPDGTC